MLARDNVRALRKDILKTSSEKTKSKKKKQKLKRFIMCVVYFLIDLLSTCITLLHTIQVYIHIYPIHNYDKYVLYTLRYA